MSFPNTTPVNLSPVGGKLLDSEDANIAGDVSTTALFPAMAVLFTATLTSTLVSSLLHINFYASWFHTGAFPGTNAAAVFRFLLNGVVIPPSRACTENQVTSRIATNAYDRRLTVAAGVQLVTCEWTRFGAPASTLRINAGSSPDLFGASMTIQNWKL